MAEKTTLTFGEIGANLKNYNWNLEAQEVPYALLECIGVSKTKITRYRSGLGTAQWRNGDLLIKKSLCFKACTSGKHDFTLNRIKEDPVVVRNTPAIIAVSDGFEILAYDPSLDETYEINQLDKLYTDYQFFSPIWGISQFRVQAESDADVKAAYKLSKLHDEIRRCNSIGSEDDLTDLNLFLMRLLFCYFAEDTGIFPVENLFSDTIRTCTKPDGSDLSEVIEALFVAMDMPEEQRPLDMPSHIRRFPYVNGGLFHSRIAIPSLNYLVRKKIIECGSLNWAKINPDIFGSMVQAVVSTELRSSFGMHYTSVPNIMKVIKPLFLDDLNDAYLCLRDELNTLKETKWVNDVKESNNKSLKKAYIKAYKSFKEKCYDLLKRISRIKFFDPACGSGNFLIITYKELRYLENKILKLIRESDGQGVITYIDQSYISINQFYGIELDDFAADTAILSLWLAEHQMNQVFQAEFQVNLSALPLKSNNQIVKGNACRIDWNKVCPHTDGEEVYVFGNPPYLGSKLQNFEQKADLELVYQGSGRFKDLDYIACWFILACRYMNTDRVQAAFVSTNSIVQGEQVPMLWPEIFSQGIHIKFAYKSFKWSNNAQHNAGVFCVIIGLSKCFNDARTIYSEQAKTVVSSISPYLTDGKEFIISGSFTPIQGFPLMEIKNMTYDGGNLIFDQSEKNELVSNYPQSNKYIIKVLSGSDFLKGTVRYSFWISDEELEDAMTIPPIRERIDLVRKFRLKSGSVARSLSDRPHSFRFPKRANEIQIVIPRVSAENRIYYPAGIVAGDTITTDATYGIYDCGIWILGIILSKMQMAWLRTLCGRLGNGYRYSSSICYNSFPFPDISETKKQEIEEAVNDVLDVRDSHVGWTLAELYDPDKMPEDLRCAHHRLDQVVDSCYRTKPFTNDEERLNCLFSLYERLINNN